MNYFTLILTVCFQCSLGAQTIQPAPEDKSVVYFVRANAIGAAMNFIYFDSTRVIGRFNGLKYFRYECDPGEHLFWARGENSAFLKANLEAGKIYVIDVRPQLGMMTARVKLVPINSSDYTINKIKKLLAKRDSESFAESKLKKYQKRMSNSIERELERYYMFGETSNMLSGFYFSPEDLKYTKK